VDLDFPVVYRAAAGLDSIAQAAGRCNREGRLGRLGEVRVFVAPTQPPPGVPRFGLSVTREMVAAEPCLDALDPAVFDRYFQKLYLLQASLDESEIQTLRESWQFASVADAFALIEQDGVEAVVVPFGDAAARLDDLRKHGPSRDRLRALQPFVVKVYAKDDVVSRSNPRPSRSAGGGSPLLTGRAHTWLVGRVQASPWHAHGGRPRLRGAGHDRRGDLASHQVERCLSVLEVDAPAVVSAVFR